MTSEFLTDVLGVMEAYFKVAGPGGARIKENSGTYEIRDTGDTAFSLIRAANIAAGGGLNDLVALLSLQGRIPEITFDFDGGSPPTPPANSGEFGMCHTTGGGFTQGRVYYDDGTTNLLMPTEVVRTITTSTAITGAISFIANGVYAAPDGVTWVIKGDGTGAVTGLNRTIKVPFVLADDGTPVDSTTSIPDGAEVLDARLNITTAFGGSPTIALTVNGSSPETLIATSKNDPTAVYEYHALGSHAIDSSSEGLVRVDLNGATTTGVGYALVTFALPLS